MNTSAIFSWTAVCPEIWQGIIIYSIAPLMDMIFREIDIIKHTQYIVKFNS